MAAMPMAMAYAPDCAKTEVLVHVRHGRDSSAPYLFMTLPYFSLLIDVGRSYYLQSKFTNICNIRFS